jgi:dinuclear metal center YbgI/SA1388 family protein
MTIEQLYAYLESRIPRTLSAAWDNDGLACAPVENAPVRRVLVALDATEQVVDLAVSGGFDLLLTHHPLLFRGVKELTPTRNVPRKLLKLARAGVAAMSFHTRLDAVDGGVNDILAARLGLLDTVPFGPAGEVACGRIGTLASPVSVRDLADTVCRALHIPAVLTAGEGEVRTVAVLGGEGGDFVAAARRAGADAFVSGRIGYHRMLDAAEDGIVLIEAGHFATEVAVCHALARMVRALDDTLTVDVYTTPALREVFAKE